MRGEAHQKGTRAAWLPSTLLLIPAAAFSTAPEMASSAFNVTPLRIELDSNAQFSTFQIRNVSAAPMAVQARGFAWSQQDSADRFAPTADIAISPSIIEIAPGEVQHFKLVRRTGAQSASESSYRLIIDQLPDERSPQAGAAATRLRVSIPVFVNRNLAQPAKLGWTTLGNSIGLTNAGGRSVKLGKLSIVTADGQVHDMGIKGPRYVLSGATSHWSGPESLRCIPAGSYVTGMLDNAPLREPIPQSCG